MPTCAPCLNLKLHDTAQGDPTQDLRRQPSLFIFTPDATPQRVTCSPCPPPPTPLLPSSCSSLPISLGQLSILGPV